MRSLALTVSLALALPLLPTIASANDHGCTQLRQTVVNRVPATTRLLPYDALSCRSVSLIYALTILRNANNNGRLEDRIEAVFRREGLVR